MFNEEHPVTHFLFSFFIRYRYLATYQVTELRALQHTSKLNKLILRFSEVSQRSIELDLIGHNSKTSTFAEEAYLCPTKQRTIKYHFMKSEEWKKHFQNFHLKLTEKLSHFSSFSSQSSLSRIQELSLLPVDSRTNQSDSLS